MLFSYLCPILTFYIVSMTILPLYFLFFYHRYCKIFLFCIIWLSVWIFKVFFTFRLGPKLYHFIFLIILIFFLYYFIPLILPLFSSLLPHPFILLAWSMFSFHPSCVFSPCPLMACGPDENEHTLVRGVEAALGSWTHHSLPSMFSSSILKLTLQRMIIFHLLMLPLVTEILSFPPYILPI